MQETEWLGVLLSSRNIKMCNNCIFEPIKCLYGQLKKVCVSPHPAISSLNDTSLLIPSVKEGRPAESSPLTVPLCWSLFRLWSTFKALVSVSVQNSSVSTFCCPVVQPVLLIHGRWTSTAEERRGDWGRGNICRRTKGGTTECRASFSFSFVSLESFPLLPLEETAAPTTQTLNWVLKRSNIKFWG